MVGVLYLTVEGGAEVAVNKPKDVLSGGGGSSNNGGGANGAGTPATTASGERAASASALVAIALIATNMF